MRIGGGLLDKTAEAAAPEPAAAVPTPPPLVFLGMATRPAESRPALEAIDIIGSWITKLSKQSSTVCVKHINTNSSYAGTLYILLDGFSIALFLSVFDTGTRRLHHIFHCIITMTPTIRKQQDALTYHSDVEMW